MRDNTVDIFVEWFRAQGWQIEDGVVLIGPNGKLADLVSLANTLEIKEKRGERFKDAL